MMEEALDGMSGGARFYREMDDAVIGMAKLRSPEIDIVSEESGVFQPMQKGNNVGVAGAFGR